MLYHFHSYFLYQCVENRDAIKFGWAATEHISLLLAIILSPLWLHPPLFVKSSLTCPKANLKWKTHSWRNLKVTFDFCPNKFNNSDSTRLCRSLSCFVMLFIPPWICNSFVLALLLHEPATPSLLLKNFLAVPCVLHQCFSILYALMELHHQFQCPYFCTSRGECHQRPLHTITSNAREIFAIFLA